MTVADTIRNVSDEDMARILTAIILKGQGYTDEAAFNVDPKALLEVLRTEVDDLTVEPERRLMKSCKGCIHENLESQDCMHCSRAYTDEYARKEKQTNAERIRSMTDEELMEFLKKIEVGDIDYSVTFCDLCKDGGNALGLDCDECLLHWLQSECEDLAADC